MAHLFKTKVLAAVLMVTLYSSSYGATLDENYKNAVSAYQSGDFAKAGELFVLVGDELHKKDAKRAAEAYNNAAIANAQSENYQQAIDIYEKILKDIKKLPKERVDFFYQNLIKLLNISGQYASQVKKVQEYEAAFKVKGEDRKELAYQLAIGDAYLSLELYKSAADAYKLAIQAKSVEKQPDKKAMLLTTLGIAEGNLGNYDAAIKALTEALEIAKKLKQANTIAESTSNLGIIYWEKNQYEKAFELLSEALKLEDQNKLLRQSGVDMNNYGLVLKSVGSYIKAMEYFDKSLAVAQEVKNVRDEGIATVNKALLNRIGGHYDLAKTQYKRAVELFKECNFTEGLAGAYLGIGVMVMLDSQDYDTALKNFNDALDIYQKLDMPHGEAEARLQIAYLYKLKRSPSPLVGGLLFEDDEDESAIKQEIASIREQASKSMEISKKNDYQEMYWFAHQLLGFADIQEEKWEDAFPHYEEAINIVTSLYQSAENLETLGEYMAEKEDLFTEAMKVCSKLYKKANDVKYQSLMIQYADTLKNEVEKANSSLANLDFKGPKKKKLYDEINSLAKSRKRAHDAIPRLNELPKDATQEDKNKFELASKEKAELEKNYKELDYSYKNLVAKWGELYPADKFIFDSTARVDVEAIQKTLKDDQVVLHYIAMDDCLIISSITSSDVSLVEVPVKKDALTKMIRDDYLVSYIEKGIGRDSNKPKGVSFQDWSEQLYKDINVKLNNLYGYLIRPVSKVIDGKKRLYIVSDGYLAQVPFGALVKEIKSDLPEYLIENFDISYIRPSFIDAFNNSSTNVKAKKMLAIANAINPNFEMALLPGSIKEVDSASSILDQDGLDVDIAYERTYSPNLDKQEKKNLDTIFERAKIEAKPTEQWFLENLAKNHYDILYFSTHGMPMSNIIVSMKPAYKSIEKKLKQNKKPSKKALRMAKTVENSFHSNSALNGFLFMSNENEDDILAKDIDPSHDGFLTLKEILELPDDSLSSTKYVILSACNTGVTFVPAAYVDDLDQDGSEMSTEESEKELRKLGWMPGVDQVSFVDSFMRRGVNNVYGSLWFVDDTSAAIIMKDFLGNLVNVSEYPDAVSAFNAAQRKFVVEGKNGAISGISEEDKMYYSVPHPYYWAVGAIFGK